MIYASENMTRLQVLQQMDRQTEELDLKNPTLRKASIFKDHNYRTSGK